MVLRLPLCLFSPILWAAHCVALGCIRVPANWVHQQKDGRGVLYLDLTVHLGWLWLWSWVEIHFLLWRQARSGRYVLHIGDLNCFQLVQASLLGNRPLSRRGFHWCQSARLTTHLSLSLGWQWGGGEMIQFSLPAFLMPRRYTPRAPLRP